MKPSRVSNCYNYLPEQHYSHTGAFLDDPGIPSYKVKNIFNCIRAGACEKRISEAASHYKTFKEQKEQLQKLPPEADGVLIFDEVRVIARLMWNSRSERMVGFAMTHEDMANLLDVYQTLDAEAATQKYYLYSSISMA